MPTGQNASDLLAKALPRKKYNIHTLSNRFKIQKKIGFSASGSLLEKCSKGNHH